MLTGTFNEYAMRTGDFEVTVNGKEVWPRSKGRVATWPEMVSLESRVRRNPPLSNQESARGH